MKRRWEVVWYNVMGQPIRRERFWTQRAAERARRESAPPAFLPNLYTSFAERI